MASGSSEGALGEFVSAIVQIIFHLLFPLILITLCALSYLLAFEFQEPEFAFWAVLAMMALDYARSNTWAAVALGLFAVAALPLAWVALREQQLQVSRTILQWILAAGVTFGMFWLRTAWPYEDSGWQLFAFGVILFGAWAAFIEAMLGTVGIVRYIRASRPVKVRPPRQEPHGAPREKRRAADEPETI